MTRIYTLKRKDRIKSGKILDDIFLNGEVLKQNSVMLRYISCKKEKLNSLQFAVGVAKKNIPLAVDRNRIKRQIREIYRLMRPALQDKLSMTGKSFYLFFVYRQNKKPKFEVLQTDMQGIVNQLIIHETSIK